MNDLIYINGQESFIDLKFIKEYSCHINGVQRQTGVDISEVKLFLNKKETKNKYGFIISSEAKNFIMSSIISNNRLSQLYTQFQYDYENKLGNLYKELNDTKDGSIYNDIRRRINKLRLISKSCDNFDLIWIKDILKKYNVPEKYYNEDEVKIECLPYRSGDKEVFLSLNILSVNTIFVPFIENQVSLNRIELTKKEQDIINAVKELLKVKDDKTNFNDYIDNWAKKLLNSKYILLSNKKEEPPLEPILKINKEQQNILKNFIKKSKKSSAALLKSWKLKKMNEGVSKTGYLKK